MNRRDLKEGLLVTDVAGDAGIVAYWNEISVFVKYFESKEGRFASDATAVVPSALTKGGKVAWQEEKTPAGYVMNPPELDPKCKEEPDDEVEEDPLGR